MLDTDWLSGCDRVLIFLKLWGITKHPHSSLLLLPWGQSLGKSFSYCRCLHFFDGQHSHCWRVSYQLQWKGKQMPRWWPCCAKCTELKESSQRRHWIRTARTSAWWENFVNWTVLLEEWSSYFRMSKESFDKIWGDLQPFIKRKSASMRSPDRIFIVFVRTAKTIWNNSMDKELFD